MEKKKVGMESIQFWLHHTLKARLERYGKERGLTMAESLRCLIVNLPDGERVEESELTALIERLQAKREKLGEHRRAALLRTPAAAAAAAAAETEEGRNEP